MSKKIYIGINSASGEHYLNNNNIITLVKTDFAYKTTMGFELDFTYLGGTTSNSYHHILNAGGTGAATKFSINVGKNNKLLTFEGCTTSGSKGVIMSNTITENVRYVLSYIIDTVNNKGTYTLKEYATGTVLKTGTVNISSVTPGGLLSIFNSQMWIQTTGSDRGTYIKLYRLKIYDGTTLVKDLIPDPNGTIGQTAELYDTISQQNLSYTYANTEALLQTDTMNVPKEAKKVYVGVNGVPKEAKKIYIGVNGTPKLCYETTTT